MAKKNSVLKASKVLPLSSSSRKKIEAVSKRFDSKDLFPEKVRRAKETLKAIKTLPF